MNLTQLKQLYPQLANIDNRLLSILTGKQSTQPNYYTYGASEQDNVGSSALSLLPSGREPAPGYPSKAADTSKEGAAAGRYGRKAFS